jgi:hypothetical protein
MDGEGGLGPPHHYSGASRFSRRPRAGMKMTVPVTRSVTLHLEEFLQDALHGYATQQHDSPASVVRLAALYWLADRESARPSWRAPRFRRGAPAGGETVQVGLDEDTWQALEDEGRRQGVDAGVLAEHAVLYFLADLDSGRLASRLEELGDLTT